MQEKFCPSLAFYAKGIFVGQMFRKKIDCLSEEKVALPIYIQHATHLGKNHGVRFKKLGKKHDLRVGFYNVFSLIGRFVEILQPLLMFITIPFIKCINEWNLLSRVERIPFMYIVLRLLNNVWNVFNNEL